MRLSGRILAITLITIIIVIATSYVIGIMLVGLKGSESFSRACVAGEGYGL